MFYKRGNLEIDHENIGNVIYGMGTWKPWRPSQVACLLNLTLEVILKGVSVKMHPMHSM